MRDPLLSELREATANAHEPEETVFALLNIRAIFPQDLALQLKSSVTAAAKDIWLIGVSEAIARTNNQTRNT